MRVKAHIIDNDTLTARECEVLRMLCEGKMRAEIAFSIHRTLSTVSKHIESIAYKFDAHSAAEIVSIAVAKGLVDIKIIHEPINKKLVSKCLLLLLLMNHTTLDIRQPPRISRGSVKLVRSRTEFGFNSQA